MVWIGKNVGYMSFHRILHIHILLLCGWEWRFLFLLQNIRNVDFVSFAEKFSVAQKSAMLMNDFDNFNEKCRRWKRFHWIADDISNNSKWCSFKNLCWRLCLMTEVATKPECRSRLRLESAFFSDPDPESLFNFGSSRSLYGHFWSKTVGILRLPRLSAESEQELDSQIQKISGSGFKNFQTGADSESEKVTPATSTWWGNHCCLSAFDIRKNLLKGLA